MSILKVNTIQTANGTTGITFAANGQMTLANTPLQLTGGQIKFPGTQIASGDANTLDDYEEGTYSPVFYGVGGSDPTVGYTSQVGRYVKIGRTVYWQASITWNSKSAGSGTLGISLPFGSSADSGYYPTAVIAYSSGFTTPAKTGYTDPGQTAMFFTDYNVGGGNQSTSNMGSSGHVMASGFYNV